MGRRLDVGGFDLDVAGSGLADEDTALAFAGEIELSGGADEVGGVGAASAGVLQGNFARIENVECNAVFQVGAGRLGLDGDFGCAFALAVEKDGVVGAAVGRG